MVKMKTGEMLILQAIKFFLLFISPFIFISASDALDNPHNLNNTVNCADCHLTSPPAGWWTDQGGTNGVCYSCHNPSGSGTNVKTHSSANTSEQYGIWQRDCTACHNPHYQRQNRIFRSLSYLYTNTSTSVTASTLTKTGAGWTANQWAGMVLIPDSRYQSFIYRISSNSSDTITIDTGGGDAINLTYIRPGATFAIAYGKLIKEYVDNKTVKFFRNQGANSFSDGDPGTGIDGICEVCHTQTKNPSSLAARFRNTGHADTGHYESQDCTTCHPHIEGFKASCNGCHNSPPLTGKHGTHFATGSVGYGTTTVQSTASAYGFSCGICHYGTHLNTLPNNYPTPHTVEIVFAGVATQDPDSPDPGPATYAPAASSVDDPGRGWSFNYSDGTCTNTYCHGNYPGSGKNASVTFNTGTAVCGSCHEATNTTVPPSGSHSTHASSLLHNYSCSMCHNGIVGGSGPASYSIADKSKHVSGYIDWRFDTSFMTSSAAYSIAAGAAMPSDGTTPRAYGTCSTVYCHSNVQPDGGTGEPDYYDTPQWGVSAVSCGSCHNSDGNTISGGHVTHGVPAVMSSGSHTSHLAYSFSRTGNSRKCALCHKFNSSGPSNDCDSCHGSSDLMQKHVNHQVNVAFETNFVDSGSYSGTPAPGDGYGDCSNTYCHGNGTSVSTGTIPNNTSANWGSGVLACNACHGNATYADYRRAGPLYTDGTPKKNVHQLHLRANGSVLTDPSCAMCHYSVTTTNTTIADKTLHVNKTYNVNASGAGIQYFSWA
ncbi:MAG: CxxxxCH/CxxCH domain-containing protein, partial [Nitrospirota bacterium]